MLGHCSLQRLLHVMAVLLVYGNRRVTAAAAESKGAVVAVDGKMVDRPVLARAQALVEASANSSPSKT